MITKPLKDRVKEQLEKKGLSFLELERQTGIKSNRMYKWYQQGTNPKKDDADVLEKWLNDLEKPTVEVKTEKEGDYNERSLNNLTESNRVLAEANRTLAEANKTLAEANHVISKNHDQLIQLTKMIVANSTASQPVDTSHLDQHKELDRPAEDFLPPGTDLSKPAKKKVVVKK